MTYYQYLKFYDKTGKPLNLAYDSVNDTWTGNLYFDRTSINLFDNQHIFIIEEVLNTLGGIEYSFPVDGNPGATPVQVSPSNMPDNPDEGAWQTSWTDDAAADEIFTYVIIPDPVTSLPFIQSYEVQEYANPPVPYTFSSPSEHKVLATINSTALKINIAFTGRLSNIYQRTMVIKDMSWPVPKTVATIQFYGELVDEDERLRLMLENFGRKFNLQDAQIVSDYNIDEPLPDWVSINNKRQELLLTGEDIYPYIGAYKGLVNAVKFFGYQDLTIKEYWLNIDKASANYGKIQMVELPGIFDDTYAPPLNFPLVPTTSYKKTSMFGLFYNINVATGEIDQYGYPVVVDDSRFTPEEVLIKIFALKNKLQNEFLPINARIVDIVGEGIYFQRYVPRNWTDETHVDTIKSGVAINFTSNVTTGFIRDLRDFQVKRFSPGLDLPVDRFTNLVNPYTYGQVYPPYSVPGLVDSINAYYTEINTFPFPYTNYKPTFRGDEPGIIAGCPVVIQAEAFAFTWDDLGATTWDNLSYDMKLEDLTYADVSPSYLLIQSPFNVLYAPEGTQIYTDWADEVLANGDYIIIDNLGTKQYLTFTQGTDIHDNFFVEVKAFSDSFFATQVNIAAAGTTYNSKLVHILTGWGIVSPFFSGPFTWDTIDFSNFYEIEWIINLPADASTPSGYNFTVRGPVKDYYILPHFLPYTGTYTITLKLFDYFNHASVKVNTNFINVLPKEIEVAAFCRFRNSDFYTWDDMTAGKETWDELGGSTWHFPIEGITTADSPINEALLAWPRYFNQDDMLVFNPDTGLYNPLIASDAPNVQFVGTRNIGMWDNMDVTWDELYHSTWDLYDYHAEFLGGFRIFDPSFGDGIIIDSWPAFYFEETSPITSPYVLTLEEAAAQLNASTNPGIAKFTYTVRYFAGGSPNLGFIHACGKFPGADSWVYVTYVPSFFTSPGGTIYGDPYSFHKPTWLQDGLIDIDQLIYAIDNSVTPPIHIDEDLMFLDIPQQDRIVDITSPHLSPDIVHDFQYWIDNQYMKYIPPSSPDDFPFGQMFGSLPSWAGAGAFTSNDVRVFTENFSVPLGVPVFLICNFSDIPGENDITWTITNELTGELFIKTSGKPYTIVSLNESVYTVEVNLLDSNGNPAYVKKQGFIRTATRADIGQPQTLSLL